MERLKDSEKVVVADRLSSFDTRGLGLPPLPGPTVVNLSGSLVGRDFRGLVQAAPFVLYGFDSLGKDILDAWVSLGLLVSLVWQPEIENINAYTVSSDLSSLGIPLTLVADRAGVRDQVLPDLRLQVEPSVVQQTEVSHPYTPP